MTKSAVGKVTGRGRGRCQQAKGQFWDRAVGGLSVSLGFFDPWATLAGTEP